MDVSKTRPASTQRDGGFGWVVVFAFFTSSIIIDALRYSFGILYIEFLSEFGQGKGETAWIGSVMLCVYNVLGPVYAVGINKFGVKFGTTAGAIIATIGLVLSSFANQIYSLFFTYGAIQGFGLGVMFLGGWVAVGRYFEKKRGLALGIAQCGCGVGAFAVSPILAVLIDVYAWRGAMLILAGVCLNGCVLSMLYRPFVEGWVYNVDVEQEAGNGQVEKKATNDNVMAVENETLLVKEQMGALDGQNKLVHANGVHVHQNGVAKIDRLRQFLCGKETSEEPVPRSFAEMREDQLQTYQRKVNSSILNSVAWSSSRSVNSISFRPTVLGSDASLERVIAKRRRNVHFDVDQSLVELQQPQNGLQNQEKTEHKQFSWVVMERLFPRHLVTDARFLLLMLSAVFYSMATFIPITLIADYGLRVGCDEKAVAWFVSAIGIGGTIGRVLCGFVVDIECVSNVWFMTGMLGMCSLVSFLCPLLTTFPVLLTFSLVYGICIGSMYVVPAVILIDVFGEGMIAETMGVFMYVCGVVALIGTPIGGWLFDVSGSYVLSFLFTGAMYLLATVFNTCVLCTSKGTSAKDQQRATSSKDVHHEKPTLKEPI